MLKSMSFSLRPIAPNVFFAKKDVFSLRNLVVMGLMLAIVAILSRFSLYITPTFKAVSFDYLPGAMVAMLFGPWAGLAFGFASDFIMYIANPQGGYFPGYALSAMVANFIYACFLYKQPVTIWRVFWARALILVVVVFGLNYIWMGLLSGMTAGGYFTGARFINNLVQLPFHVLLTAFLGKQLVHLKPYFLPQRS